MTTVSITGRQVWLATLSGLSALALGMGLGRFAYTPILPLMRADYGLTFAETGLLASANYIGYFTGSLTATLLAGSRARMTGLRLGLLVSVVTTALMGLVANYALWLVLRFLGGVASALILVYTSSLALEAIAHYRRWRPQLGGLFYGGVGAGIAISALVVHPFRATPSGSSGAWLALAAASLILLILPWLWLRDRSPHPMAARPATASGRPSPPLLWLTLSYACFGFGYVITATFLVAIVRGEAGYGTSETLTWVIVGLAAVPATIWWAWLATRVGYFTALAGSYVILTLSVVLIPFLAGPVAIYTGALLFGATFNSIPSLTLSAGRLLMTHQAGRVLGAMTAIFSIGQIIGPVVAGVAADRFGGFVVPSLLAAGVLLLGLALVLMAAASARRAT